MENPKSPTKRDRDEEEEETRTGGTDDVLSWQRRDALLRAHEFLVRDARDSAKRIVGVVDDRLREFSVLRLALIAEGRDLEIGAMDRNPVADALTDELNEIADFRHKILRVEQLEQEWGPYQVSKL